ncbi:unnamed protein product [Microthlaspi erraticum]|uniref:Uncharacterized protein n=1 Tax=Microthlaspi erraticum TaxID=1685480 RepID=A0A6D2L533_9BRAS|nr:unnamed protein product [Microthlaspi erraticum]
MAVDCEGFSIREYTRNIRSVEVRKCWPFSGDVTGELIQSLLPPITVVKFRWWSHELASLLTKSPDGSDPAFRRKAKSNKRSVVELARREDERDDSEVLIDSKRKKSKDTFDAKTANKVNNCKEDARENADDGKCSIGTQGRSGVMSLNRKKAGVRCLSYTEEDLFPDSPKSVSQDWDSEFKIPGNLKVCSVRSPDKSKSYASQSEKHVRFSDNNGILSHLEKNGFSVEQCCLNMSKLSLFAAEDQSSVGDKKMVVVSNGNMQFQSAVSERRLSHARGNSSLSCFAGPHLSQERIKDALDLERKRHVDQPVQPFISDLSESLYRSCSSSFQHTSADMHCRTLLYQSPFDPFQVERIQRHVEADAIPGFTLNVQGELVEANGEGCRSLGTGCSISASAENDLLLKNSVDFSSGKKHSTDPAITKDGGKIPVHNERRLKYFPARLGIDEIFTEDGECGQTVHSPVPQVNPTSHTLNLHQNVTSRDMVADSDGLCLHNTQATMRLMGKDVSVGTSYSDLLRAGQRIIAPDASVDCPFLESHTQQSWLWPRTTLGISENHSAASLDKNWSRNLLCDPSKDPYPLFWEPSVCLAPEARTEFPPTFLYPCGSHVPCPLTDKDLSFHGYGSGQQLNSFTFSHQQLLPFQSHPEIPCDYNNVGIGHLPDARKPSFGLPFSCTDSTRQPQPHYWPQSSFESSSRLGMPCITNPAEQLVSLYESRSSSSSSYINVGKANKRLASVEEYPLKKQKIPKFPMQGGFNSEKESFGGQQIRKAQIYKS